MALKSLEIRFTTNVDRPSIGVFNPIYCGRPQFESRHEMSDLRMKELPRAKGFSFNMEPPYVNFKTLRSMLNGGCGEMATRVVATKSRSWITPDFVYDNLLNYCYPTKGRFSCPVYDEVLQELEHQFVPSERVKPLPFREAARTIPQSTSPGLPYIIQNPGSKKGDILDSQMERIEKFWVDVGEGRKSFLPDCAAFARSHIGDAGANKVRPVWAYPLDVVAAEAMFVQPILDQLKDQNIGRNTAYGMEMMKGGMEWLHHQSLHAKYQDPGAKFLMMDFSSFDSSIPAWLIRDCFKVLFKAFDLSVNGKYYYHVYKRLVSYFINTPVRNSDGRRLLTDHGVPSGSMFTNIIGTMVNFVITRYAVKRMMNCDPLFDIYFGDDSFVCLRSECLVDLGALKEFMYDAFGVTLSDKKTFWTNRVENIHFLGYYNNSGTPYKSSEELFASMLFPQYNKDDWSYTMARAMGCLMASAGNNFDVYMAVLSVYNRAQHHEGAIEAALDLIRNNARMRRHMLNMGLDPGEISYRYLADYRLVVPRSDCSKILNNIVLC
uniref:RdRp n=1 Tax=Hubei partiti-like virus 19 TaxID=1923025 RepID=A0A1L3KLG8_9VIRU|nr:RdRp [Hubei partiti-like virus 19]